MNIEIEPGIIIDKAEELLEEFNVISSIRIEVWERLSLLSKGKSIQNFILIINFTVKW